MVNPGIARPLVKTLVFGLLFTLAALPVGAQTAHVNKPQKSTTPAGQEASQQASIDPQGKLKEPTPEESQRLSKRNGKKFDRKPEEAKITQAPNGMLMAQLPESYMEVMVVKINPDGTLWIGCVTGLEAAEEFVQSAGEMTATPASTSELEVE